jgi:hypothetical protein
MTKRADTTVIEVADPNCGGVTDSTGRHRYDKDAKGRIEVPKHVAREILQSGHRDARLYRPVFALSMADVLERARKLKEEEHVGEAPDHDR